MLVLLLSTLLGCDSKGFGGQDFEISSDELGGFIDGVAWTFAGGETNTAMSDDMNYLGVIYGTYYEPCSRELPTGSGLILNVPMEAGEYELGPDFTATFVYDDSAQNRVTPTGLLVVEEVGAASLAGGLYAIYGADPDFEVSGRFVIDICDD